MATRLAINFMSADELRELLVEVIQGVAGGGKAGWRKLIDVERMVTWRTITHNWRVEPRGTARQRDIIARAVDVVRAEHRYIA